MNKNLWEDTKELLKYDNRINKVTLDSIIGKLKVEHESSSVLVLAARDEYSLSLLKGQELGDIIQGALRTVSGNKSINVKFVMEGDQNAVNATVVSDQAASRRASQSSPMELNEEFTFANFVVGDCNRFAYASAVSVAKNPGQKQRNPLYLWGNSGLGKTHLMKAIGYEASCLYPSINILYTTCEAFTNAFVACMNNKNYEAFRNVYRSVDVLLIDDIQFLIGKEGTQTEFFNTFEELISQGKQIVITSDKAPNNLKELDNRLTSRFQNGIMMDIQPPDFETRKAIFLSKCNSAGLTFDDEIVNYVCENITVNIRQLNGAFNTLSSFTSLTEDGTIDLDTTKKILSPPISPVTEKYITPEMIIKAVSKYYGMTPETLTSQLRRADVTEARNIAMYLCRDHLQMTLDRIGEIFGGRKHSTVLHSCDNVTNNPSLMQTASDIMKRMTEG